MNKNLIETVLGGVVLVLAAIFMFFAYNVADLGGGDGYTVVAQFNRVDGLNVGTDVRLSGIKIGAIKEQRLNKDTYMAELVMNVDNNIKLPVDTVAEVSTEGLLGGKYVSLVPGVEEEFIAPGGRILFTTPPVDLMQLLGKFIFNTAKKEAEGGAEESASEPATMVQ